MTRLNQRKTTPWLHNSAVDMSYQHCFPRFAFTRHTSDSFGQMARLKKSTMFRHVDDTNWLAGSWQVGRLETEKVEHENWKLEQIN